MPDIISTRFKATRNLTAAEMRNLVVDGSKSAMEALMKKKYRWNGVEPGAIIAAHLNADNARIMKVTLNLLGSLKGDFFSASRFWPGLPTTYKMKLTFTSLATLNFKDGLTTDLINVKDDLIEVKNNETTISLADIKTAGAGDMCFRVYCTPISADYMKVSAIGFPMSKEELQAEHPASDNLMFPGISVINKDILLMPGASEDLSWGSTFKPLIIKGSASALKTSSFDLRSKTASFLRDCLKAPSCSSLERLVTQWAALGEAEAENSLTITRPREIWPEAVDLLAGDQDEDPGKKYGLFYLKLISFVRTFLFGTDC